MKWVLGFGVLALLASLTGFTIDLTIIFGSGSEIPGPSLALFNSQKYYSCTNNRFVSTSGLSTNNGLTSGTPWDLPTAATYSAPAGTCINLATGVYSGANITLTIAHGGTSSTTTGYVVWRCSSMPFSFSSGVLQGEGNGCVLRDTNGSSYIVSINSGVNYVMFDGLEFDGNNANAGLVCVDDENGGTQPNLSHHIWLLNSDVHGCGQAGIQWNYNDWLFVIHNVWHDNSFTLACGSGCASGLSFYEPVGITYTPTPGNPDYWHSTTTGLTYNIVLAYNVGYHNFNPQSGTGNTDGEGFELDDWGHAQNTCPGSGTCPYNGNALVMGNIMYNNGGGGIQAFSFDGSVTNFTGHVTIVNNTTYANYWDTHNTATFRANILLNDTRQVSVFNNIGQAWVGTGINADNSPFLSCCSTTTPAITWQTNLSYPGGINNFDGTAGTYPTVGTNKNLDGSDPKLKSVNCSAGTCTGGQNFALQGTSPAIGFGQAFDLWQQSGSVDAGACVSGLANCP